MKVSLTTLSHLRCPPHPLLQPAQSAPAGVGVSGEIGKICCSRWLKLGAVGSIIQAGGAGGVGQLLATGCSDGDVHAASAGSQISTQAVLLFLSMGEFLVTLLIEQGEPLLQLGLLLLGGLQLGGSGAADLAQG